MHFTLEEKIKVLQQHDYNVAEESVEYDLCGNNSPFLSMSKKFYYVYKYGKKLPYTNNIEYVKNDDMVNVVFDEILKKVILKLLL